MDWVAYPFWDLSDPGIEPGSPALQADSLQSEPPEKFLINHTPLESFPFPGLFTINRQTS